MKQTLVLATLFICPSASLLRSASSDDEVRVVLSNQFDMSFTGNVMVGGEEVNPIMDTGSFEIVLFAKNCVGCLSSSTFFDENKTDNSFKKLDLISEQAYGSGRTVSSGSTAMVTIGESRHALAGPSQLFWLANEVNLNFDVDDSFSGIFGLGPPKSALEFALDDLAYLQEAIGNMDEEQASEYTELTKTLKALVKLEKQKKPWMYNMAVKVFSICLLPGFKNSGYMIYNDQAAQAAQKKAWVETTSGGFWEVSVSDVAVGTAKLSDSLFCSGVMDSGTSLMGLPQTFYTDVVNFVQRGIDTYGGCDDLTSWPNFEMTIGNQRITLGPTSYVATYDFAGFQWEVPQELSSAQNLPPSRKEILQRLMPHLDTLRARSLKAVHRGQQKESSTCGPAVFSLGEIDPSTGCELLFGLPLFREYYVSHKITANGAAKSMMFARSDGDCLGFNRTVDLKAAHRPVSPLVVKPSQIRFPGRALRSLHKQFALRHLNK